MLKVVLYTFLAMPGGTVELRHMDEYPTLEACEVDAWLEDHLAARMGIHFECREVKELEA